MHDRVVETAIESNNLVIKRTIKTTTQLKALAALLAVAVAMPYPC